MTKKDVIEKIFILCTTKNDFIFDNNTVKKVLQENGGGSVSRKNPYDMTKIDELSKLPDKLIKEGYAIIHLGGGKHKFIKPVDKIYHSFENIDDNEIIEWPYRPSILNDYSASEASILSLANNHRILHDFLYQDFSAAPKMYNSERKRVGGFDYFIGAEKLQSRDLQIEIDLTIEHNGYVTVFEGKNARPNKWIENFNVYQLYNPFRYYHELRQSDRLAIKRLSACYLVKQNNNNEDTNIRLYNYTFENPLDMATIKIMKKKEYRLKKRRLEDE
jgi:hypothetical protein